MQEERSVYSRNPVPGPGRRWPPPWGCTPGAWWAPDPWSGCTPPLRHLGAVTKTTSSHNTFLLVWRKKILFTKKEWHDLLTENRLKNIFKVYGYQFLDYKVITTIKNFFFKFYNEFTLKISYKIRLEGCVKLMDSSPTAIMILHDCTWSNLIQWIRVILSGDNFN